MAAAVSRSVHQILGGGFVADALLWRNKSASISILTVSTALYILFDFAGYNPVSLAANSFLLLFAIVFFWAKSATLLNRPLPPIPNMEISDEVVEKYVARARVWVNSVLSVAKDIAIKRNRMVFAQVILSLWLISYIGSFSSFLTLVYIGIVLLFTVPVLYNKYRHQIDKHVGAVHSAILMHYDDIVTVTAGQPIKEKKTC